MMNFRFVRILAILAFTCLLPLRPGMADEHPPVRGIYSVVLTTGCGSHFFVSSEYGYSLLTWLGGRPVINNDILVGSVDREGQTTLLNQTWGNQEMTVIVESALMTKGNYQNRAAQLCPH